MDNIKSIHIDTIISTSYESVGLIMCCCIDQIGEKCTNKIQQSQSISWNVWQRAFETFGVTHFRLDDMTHILGTEAFVSATKDIFNWTFWLNVSMVSPPSDEFFLKLLCSKESTDKRFLGNIFIPWIFIECNANGNGNESRLQN